jgi:hypothetical protein
MARYHAWIVSRMVWATDPPDLPAFMYPKPVQPRTNEEVARNLDMWATVLGAVPAPANEVPA